MSKNPLISQALISRPYIREISDQNVICWIFLQYKHDLQHTESSLYQYNQFSESWRSTRDEQYTEDTDVRCVQQWM